MRHFITRALVLGLLVGPASGCIPTEFDDRRGLASTRAIEPPEDYPNTRFGNVVVGYSGTLAGEFVSRVGGTAGTDTPFTVYPALVGDEIRLDNPTIDGCDQEAPCDRGAGASLVGMARFADRSLCVATTAMETGFIKVNCEDDPTRFEAAMGPTGERFGFAGAGLPRFHPFGAALYGAPGAAGGAGALYRLRDTAVTGLDLSMGMAPAARELGSSVAIGILDDDTVLVAAGAPRGSMKRVIVATVDIDGADGSGTVSVRGCMDATTRGFGEALAIGDFDGDGTQDVAIGSGPGEGADLRDNTVHVYAGSSMPPPDSCVGAWPEATAVNCPTGLEGVTCDGDSTFGAALSVGDVNGDGVDDLVVGAPTSEVDGTGGAGAVYVFPGSDRLSTLDDTVSALVHSSPSTNANLGQALSTVPGQADDMGRRRDEVVAGAPGENRFYIFLCSSLEGDRREDFGGTQCQPSANP